MLHSAMLSAIMCPPRKTLTLNYTCVFLPKVNRRLDWSSLLIKPIDGSAAGRAFWLVSPTAALSRERRCCDCLVGPVLELAWQISYEYPSPCPSLSNSPTTHTRGKYTEESDIIFLRKRERHLCVCIYTHMHIYRHMHIYIHIYIHIQSSNIHILYILIINCQK